VQAGVQRDVHRIHFIQGLASRPPLHLQVHCRLYTNQAKSGEKQSNKRK
jgi:hypothetical protein